MRIRSAAAVMTLAALTLAACGDDDGDDSLAAASAPTESAAVPPSMPRRVEVQMADISFSPPSVDVKVGETISFVFTNTGKIPHDAFVGDKAAQDEHETEMRAMTDPNDHASHEGGITVAAGQTGAIRQIFDKTGTFEIGCHQPGHYAAGMKLVINVT